jgi:hypothetical protein
MPADGIPMKSSTGWRRARAVLVGIAAAALALRATAQTSAAPASVPVAAPELAAIDAQLRRGEWEEARAGALARIEADRTKPAALDLARDVSRLALAEAGLGRKEDALWHWGVAQNLDRAALSPAELASFGAPGELLAQHPLRHLDEAPVDLKVYKADDPDIQPPRRTSGELPQLAEDPNGGVLRIQGIVDREGRFREPTVLGEGSPDTIYRVLEALHEWRYLPARRNLRRVASFRSVYVGAVGAEGPAADPLRLGQQPIPKPGGEARVFPPTSSAPVPVPGLKPPSPRRL